MRRCTLSLVLMFLAVAPISRACGQPRADFKAERLEQMRRAEMLERFRALTAPARWQLLAKHGVKPAWHTVAKGEAVAEVVERGTVEAVRATDIICRLKTGDIVIKWVIDDGTPVKRGDKVLEFDDSHLRELLKKQRLQVELALAQMEQATRELSLVQREGKLAIREAVADIAAAEREAKAYPGGDAVKKEVLELKVERTRLGLERARVVLQSRLLQAEAELRAKTALAEQEQTRFQGLQEELGHAVATAPHDGMLVYYVPDSRRFSAAAPAPIVAQGEPVRPGQKLLRVADLSRLAVRIDVPEAQVSRMRKDMPVTIRVDALPKQTFPGKVAAIANVADQQLWMARDIKAYPALIHLDGEPSRLKPGMTAEARILLDRREDVLTVPPQAIVRSGKERYCYVRAGEDKIELRTLVLGVLGDRAVEVREGLHIGDPVLADPSAVVQRLGNILPPPPDKP